ncbi:MAG: hypothetical protein CK424_01075 [Legionella sp.]|nr:MAG: hypothetical protein CK424_01075 [Legionella sp.]
MNIEERKAKIRWQSRRGMLELDVILERFLKARLNDMTTLELDVFEAVLNNPDPDLYAWLMGYESSSNKEFADCVTTIRSYNQFKSID